ncbi:MAG: Rieske 2Fe-2S domain-containing protein [Bacteroidales bacterium]|jgi:Rieske Fe-S protein|nr:Rieske 2Fe-2S domain-containing protein [Bacteroidales bacterium]
MNWLVKKFKMRVILISVLAILLFVKCDEDDYAPFPYIYFNVTLSISNDLLNMNIGEYKFVDGYNYGVGGLIIYRYAYSDYLAFDRACTHEAKSTCVVEDDPEFSGLMVKCPCCGSMFNVSDGFEGHFGSVFNGPAKRALMPYKTYFLQPNSLIVYNN